MLFWGRRGIYPGGSFLRGGLGRLLFRHGLKKGNGPLLGDYICVYSYVKICIYVLDIHIHTQIYDIVSFFLSTERGSASTGSQQPRVGGSKIIIIIVFPPPSLSSGGHQP